MQCSCWWSACHLPWAGTSRQRLDASSRRWQRQKCTNVDAVLDVFRRLFARRAKAIRGNAAQIADHAKPRLRTADGTKRSGATRNLDGFRGGICKRSRRQRGASVRQDKGNVAVEKGRVRGYVMPHKLLERTFRVNAFADNGWVCVWRLSPLSPTPVTALPAAVFPTLVLDDARRGASTGRSVGSSSVTTISTLISVSRPSV